MLTIQMLTKLLSTDLFVVYICIYLSMKGDRVYFLFTFHLILGIIKFKYIKKNIELSNAIPHGANIQT